MLLVEQATTVASVSFDDEAVADLFDQQVDAGVDPQRFARIWLHTHPGDSAEPSATDEETFERVFGSCNWAVMFILAKGGQTYARVRFNVGPGGQAHLPVAVDYEQPFEASDHEAWEADYERCVHPAEPHVAPGLGMPDYFDEMGGFMDSDELDELDGFERPVEAVGDLDDLEALMNGPIDMEADDDE